ncbi:MAG: SLC13 family permease [Verrucomicrobia bacterium]|nr:SLC13 family permease [Verrucomicrobiota bacterium]
MNPQFLFVIGLLVACIGMFVANKPRMDVIALLVIVILSLSGILKVSEAIAGFSDPNVILIAAMFVIGEGLVRTGIALRLGDWLVAKAAGNETRLLVLLMLATAGLGSVMSSTGVVAIFIPVVLGIADRMGVQPGRLMMPLSFSALISGMLTLVATPPNLVVDSALRQSGLEGFRLLSFTPFGVTVLAVGIVYMLAARHWLGVQMDKHPSGNRRRNLLDLIRDYQLAGRERRFRIRPDSPLVGKLLEDLGPRRHHGANIVAIERETRFRREFLGAGAHTELRAADILFIDLPTFDRTNVDQSELSSKFGLEELPLQGTYFMDQSQEIGMAEVILPPDSEMVGNTLLQLTFRNKYGLNVIGLRRGQHAFNGNLLKEKLRSGDTLLVIGPWKAIRQLQTQRFDFLVLSLPAEVDQVAPAVSQAPHALVCLLAVIAMMVTGIVPNVIAALVGCLLMGLFRCIDLASAYKSIHWQILLLIVGMMPFALALQKTGGVDLAVDGLLRLFGKGEPRLLLAVLFALTALIGLFISNTATAVLMTPVALSAAHHLKASPYPFAMTVALAASAAFMTPISSPVNTLVLGPGQYRFNDFVKIGVPFTFLVMVISVLLVPWLFPLH